MLTVTVAVRPFKVTPPVMTMDWLVAPMVRSRLPVWPDPRSIPFGSTTGAVD